MSESISCHHEKDGTLVVTVPKGTNVGRVLVQEEGTCIGSLYYSDHFAESSKMMDTISRQAAIDALNMADDKGQIHSILDVNDVIKSLPSAQPEEVIPHRNYKYLSDYWCACGWHLGKKGDVKYCADCGRKVNWDE